jgi:hypothetical protein
MFGSKLEAFDQILLQLCNGVYDGKPIEKWTENCILPFPKKEILDWQVIIEESLSHA